MTPGVVPLLDIFPLHIFPESGLHGSIITTVLVGLVFMVIMNEWFGWVLSGLVVPGYLAPIFIIQPWSGAVIVVEAILTHLCVMLFSGPLQRLGWRSFFGRDRFFAYLLFGTLIRALLEGYLLLKIGAALNDHLGLAIDYRNSFYSVGLIVVPLLANMFYKPGLLRGALPVTVQVLLCYGAIQLVLVPYTNFSISSFELSYGYYATSFVGNAKAYVILLTSAYLASRTNLAYGWDYNGILVPSLLALAWFHPTKVLTTLAESILILHLTRWFAGTRIFGGVTVEAGRKLLLCFSTGYALKLIVGFWVGARYPGMDATELYGFGYLLPSLIASKMWQKDSAGLILRPLVQTSLTGTVVGSIVTSGLLFAFPPTTPLTPGSHATDTLRVRAVQGDLLDTLRADKARLVRRSTGKGADRAYGAEQVALQRAVSHLRAAQDAGPGSDDTRRLLYSAAAALHSIDYELITLEDPRRGRTYYVARELANAPGSLHGWGIYVFSDAARSELVLEVPRPLAEWKAIEAGAALLERLDARALLIAGADPLAGRTSEADVLGNPASPFHTVHRMHATHDVVSVRGETDGAVLSRRRPTDPTGQEPGARDTQLFVEGRLPDALHLEHLRTLLGGPVELRLPGSGRYEDRNVQRRDAKSSYATLVLHPAAAQHLISQYYSGYGLSSQARLLAIDGYLLQWAQTARRAVAPTGSEAFRAPTTSELLFMDDEILTPIVRAQRASRSGTLDVDQLRELSRAAERVGYELLLYTYRLTGERFLILRESDEPPDHVTSRFGGTFVFRLGAGRPVVVEVPYPVTDLYTFEGGARMLELLRAQALIIAGASRYANADMSADVGRPRNARTYFQLAHQVLVREGAGATLAVQLRGFAGSTRPGVDVVLSSGKAIRHRADLPQRLLDLEGELMRLRIPPTWADGSQWSLPFGIARGPQWKYAEAMHPGTFVTCWLSRELRDRFRGRLAVLDAHGEAVPDLGMPRLRGNLMVHLVDLLERWRRRDASGVTRTEAPRQTREHVERVIRQLERYVATDNIVHLAEALHEVDEAGGQLMYFLDASSARAYLVYTPPEGLQEVFFVVSLHASLRERMELVRTAPTASAELLRYVREGFESLRVLHPPSQPQGGRR
jgi:hypothetical protein